MNNILTLDEYFDDDCVEFDPVSTQAKLYRFIKMNI